MAQPKISIPREPLDHFLTAVAGFGLLLMLGLTIYYYDQLPDDIPTHFNLRGEPDNYGSKNMLWLLFIISLGVYFFLEMAARRPHLGNYSAPVTEENAARQYRNMQRMTRMLNAIVVLFLAYIVHASIQTAFGNRDGLSMWVGLLFVALIIGILAYFLARAKIMER